MKPKLDKWIIYGNCLVGYIYDTKAFPPGTRIKTDAIVEVDLVAQEVRCVDGTYRMLEPGTEMDHRHEIHRHGDVIGNLRVGDFSTSKPVEEKTIVCAGAR